MGEEGAHRHAPIVRRKKINPDGGKCEGTSCSRPRTRPWDGSTTWASRANPGHERTTGNSDVDPALIATLDMIEYGDHVVYVHSDTPLMPRHRAAWGSWNCMGRSALLDIRGLGRGKDREAMEGSASGFGRTLGERRRIRRKATSRWRVRAAAMYHPSHPQNLETYEDGFVSLNPHTPPKPELVYRRQVMAHPQFVRWTHEGRDDVNTKFQRRDGVWFCGVQMGYEFHEDASF